MDKQRKSPWLIDCKLPCLECKYDLFQLTGPVIACPECGEINDLRLPEQWKSHFQSLPPKQKKEEKIKYGGPLSPACVLFLIAVLTFYAVGGYPTFGFYVLTAMILLLIRPYSQLLSMFIKSEQRFGSNRVQIATSVFFSYGMLVFPALIMYTSYRLNHMYTWWVELYIVACLVVAPASGWVSLRVLNSYKKYCTQRTTPLWMRFCKAIRQISREQRRNPTSRPSR